MRRRAIDDADRRGDGPARGPILSATGACVAADPGLDRGPPRRLRHPMGPLPRRSVGTPLRTASHTGTCHANVVTLNDATLTANAMVVRSGRILAVGDLCQVEQAAGPMAERRDMVGHTLVPGVIDAHGYFCPSRSSSRICSRPQVGALRVSRSFCLLCRPGARRIRPPNRCKASHAPRPRDRARTGPRGIRSLS